MNILLLPKEDNKEILSQKTSKEDPILIDKFQLVYINREAFLQNPNMIMNRVISYL